MVKHLAKQSIYEKEFTPFPFNFNSYQLLGETFDSIRFSKTNTMPFSVRFKDGSSILHTVTLEAPQDQYQLTIPARNEIIWSYESDGDVDRTGLDKDTALVVVVFSFIEKSWTSSHGVRVHVKYFKAVDKSIHVTNVFDYQNFVIKQLTS